MQSICTVRLALPAPKLGAEIIAATKKATEVGEYDFFCAEDGNGLWVGQTSGYPEENFVVTDTEGKPLTAATEYTALSVHDAESVLTRFDTAYSDSDVILAAGDFVCRLFTQLFGKQSHSRADSRAQDFQLQQLTRPQQKLLQAAGCMIRFWFEETGYLLLRSEIGTHILLPDKRLFRVDGWLESNPPQPSPDCVVEVEPETIKESDVVLEAIHEED